ncbi:hypothetical protein Adt_35172 [Abeliophyllum distichum]|uniref:Uncharacterized protein n=1 Tax=Abeliophyllum distichum TaxID=126358 RepID=A0ABD1QE77_9LAMI
MLAKAARKLAKDRTTSVESTVTSVNYNFDTMVAKKDKQLAESWRELEKMKEDLAEAKARAVTSYKKEFSNTPEYLYLANHFMVADGKEFTERIRELLSRMRSFIPNVISH